MRRSPSHIRHLLPPSVLPMKEFHSYHEHQNISQQYRTSSTINDSYMLLHHQRSISGDGMGMNIGGDSDFLFDIDFGGVMESRTQTTLLQHNLGPPDLPPMYQPQHRASI